MQLIQYQKDHLVEGTLKNLKVNSMVCLDIDLEITESFTQQIKQSK